VPSKKQAACKLAAAYCGISIEQFFQREPLVSSELRQEVFVSVTVEIS
jgi:hypothetical protein